QFSQVGSYSVQITNAFGQTNSASATLTVNPPPPCTNPPPGLLSWWRAEGNALDQQGGNNGALINGAGFAPGESGSAFNLNGANQYVLITTPNLNVGLASGFTVEGWINPANVAN